MNGFLESLRPKIQHLSSALADLEKLPGVKEVRQCGLIAGIEIEELPNGLRLSLPAAACIEARRHGLLTRPIDNVVVLMPPLCITTDQLTKAAEALRLSIAAVSQRSAVAARKNAEEVTT